MRVVQQQQLQMSSTEYYSSDDCWEGECTRSPPSGRGSALAGRGRKSFEVARPSERADGARLKRSGSGNLDESALFWEKEPEGHRKYEVVKVVGKGQYGVVVSARHRRTGKKCAIKHISGVFFLKDDAIKTIRELRFLRVFRHPNVVGLHDVLVPLNAQTFDDVYLVTELMETDLDKLIKSKTVLHERHTRWIMYQLLRGLAYIHGANVSHRDVKPANIVLDSECNLKLCDFGLSRADFPRESDTPIFWTDYVATRWYRAPELICSHYEQYTTQIDIWAAGCIMGELVKRRPLFPGRNVYNQMDLITSFCGTPSQSTIVKMRNQRARDHLMRQVPPKKPVDCSSMFPSLGDEGLSMLHGLLTFDPNDRATAATSCQHVFFQEIRQSIDESFIQPPPQMDERDFAWEDEEQHTTAELRRKLYDEILGFHPEALARGIALAAAKQAVSEDGDATEESSAKSRRSLSVTDALEGAVTAAMPRTSRDIVGDAPEDNASCVGAVAKAPSSDTSPRNREDAASGRAVPEFGEHEVEDAIVPTGSREEQWGHLRMGNNTGEASTDCDCYSDDGEHGQAAAAPSAGSKVLQRRPSMCSLTSGSDNSEPISHVSEHVWSSHEFHNHHLFHEEPSLPKFPEEKETEEMKLYPDSPGGRSDSETDGDDAASPLKLVLGPPRAPSTSPGRPYAKTPQRSSSRATLSATNASNEIGATELAGRIKAAYTEGDTFAELSLVASRPALQRQMSWDPPGGTQLPLKSQERQRPTETAAKNRRGSGLSCCGSRPR